MKAIKCCPKCNGDLHQVIPMHNLFSCKKCNEVYIIKLTKEAKKKRGMKC